ncbi:MAG: ATP-binding cassette domain-containing protein [Verrucomicrobiae bacterium]|nr:ATP-binding cassette domain-containing protein [Verrucomicrobiae bacterium]
MNRTLRNTWVITLHELADSIRSRRAIVLLILYTLNAIVATLLFVRVLHELENQLEKAAGVTKSETVGGTTSALWKNRGFREMLSHLVGNRETAEKLLETPPLPLFYGWLSFFYTPLLVMLMSASRISEEIWSGSVRFAMFRTSRLSWCVGKYAGQALQLLVALLLSGLAAWITGWLRMAFFDPGANAAAIMVFSLKAWVYGLAFLGLAMGVSQTIASPHLATAVGVIAMVVCAVISMFADWITRHGQRHLQRGGPVRARRPQNGPLAARRRARRSGDGIPAGARRGLPARRLRAFLPEEPVNAALELRGVVKTYGRCRALDGLDLSVPRGSIFGLVGSNGAGKTTALAVSVGLLQSDAGSVSLLGEGPFDPLRHAGRVTLLPQDSRLPLHARVEELLWFYGRLQGLKDGALRRSVDEVLEWVHLRDRRRSPVRTLSHGMMRRLTIAQAFLGRPELVLLDEPMSGLDPREAARIRAILHHHRGAQTVVISSHDLRELESLCDTAAFIENGRLVRQDSMDNLTRRGERVTFTLELDGRNLPLDELKSALPGAAWETARDGAELTARFENDRLRASEVNARVCEILLRHRIGILEIRRGSNLEGEYLAATANMIRDGGSRA